MRAVLHDAGENLVPPPHFFRWRTTASTTTTSVPFPSPERIAEIIHQVKQQGRRSSKWTCVVCNQRQSILRVFARGPLAKDVRLFVQRFNMSRSSDAVQIPPLPVEERSISSDEANPVLRKRRVDWSEYLDPEVEKEEPEASQGVFVTEMPTRQTRKYPQRFAREGEPLKPNFTKKRVKWKEPEKSRLLQEVRDVSHSKWNRYMEGAMEKVVEGDVECANNDLWEDGDCGVRVEEEVHPDFV